MQVRDIGVIAIVDIAVHILGVVCVTLILYDSSKWIDKRSLRGILVAAEVFYAASILASFTVLFSSFKGLNGALMFSTICVMIAFCMDVIAVGKGLGYEDPRQPGFWKSDTSYILLMVLGGVTLFDFVFIFTSIIGREKVKDHKRRNPKVDHSAYSLAKLLFADDDDDKAPNDVEQGARRKKKPSFKNKKDYKTEYDNFDPSEESDPEIQSLMSPTIIQAEFAKRTAAATREFDSSTLLPAMAARPNPIGRPVIEGRRVQQPQVVAGVSNYSDSIPAVREGYLEKRESPPPRIIEARRVVAPITTISEQDDSPPYLSPMSAPASPTRPAPLSPVVGRIVR